MTASYEATSTRAARRAACAGLTALTLICAANTAHAEVGQPKAPSGAKATVGLAMLGAEATVTVEALVGVKPWWGYAIGGVLGGAAGGVGGYFIDRADAPGVSMGILAGGIVLAVPATLGVLSATAYKPPKNPEVDQALRDRRLVAIGQAIAERHALAHSLTPTPLLTLDAQAWADGITPEPSTSRFATIAFPAATLRPVYTDAEVALYGMDGAASSVRVPVLNISF